MKKLIFVLIGLWFCAGYAQDEWLTYYERSGFVATPRYDETIAFCKKLDSASAMIYYTTFGYSPQGRALPLMIADKDGNFDPASVKRSGKPVILMQAGIHAGEIDGKDAALVFFRDMVVYNKYVELLDKVTLLFIPIFSVDGHERFGPYNRINQNGPTEMGWRTTAQNLNLNRDYLKADSPEIAAWLKLWQAWRPDFFVDFHVTDGADYQYVSTYGLEIYGNMDPELTQWTTDTFIPAFSRDMEKSGFPVFPYVSYRRWHDPESGLSGNMSSPRLSQGYTALRNRVGLLIENHSLKPYKPRVEANIEQIRIVCEIIGREGENIKKLNDEADRECASPDFRKTPFTIRWKQTNDSTMVEFKGIEYEKITSDLTGGDWFIYHSEKPKTFAIPFFHNHIPSVSVQLPAAYIVPPEWIDVIQRLRLHGIKYVVLEKDAELEIDSYRFSNPRWSRIPFEGRFAVEPEVENITEKRVFPAGSVIIPIEQNCARVIANIFEPQAPDSYLYWGFFTSIFEQKEYAETYIMEKKAREMIKDNPELLTEFEKLRAENEEFAKNQWAQLNWFFSKSPWFDQKLNVYPVGKIMNGDVVESLLH